MRQPIKAEDLVIHILNVGFGDNILIEFPVKESGERLYGLVDCKNGTKTIKYLDKLVARSAAQPQLAFVCATHPHYDHISGINSILKHSEYSPREFWDSGFRHKSRTYLEILETLYAKGIRMVRVPAGMERYFGKVRITALSPSVMLRNRYATYGVDMNNASIVLRIEHHDEDALLMTSKEYKGDASLEAEREAGRSVVILTGDAEFDAWAQICRDYPTLERTSENKPLVKKMINYLSCSVIKVAHHGSMHSTSLDVYEKMDPEVAIISNDQETSTRNIGGRTLTRELFPHQTSVTALEEVGAKILTTDGSYEGANPGSIIVVVPPGGKPRYRKLEDESDDVPDPVAEV